MNPVKWIIGLQIVSDSVDKLSFYKNYVSWYIYYNLSIYLYTYESLVNLLDWLIEAVRTNPG